MHRRLIALFFAVVVLGRSTPAGAHRLDEYLQATRVAVGVARVSVDVDLTPGVSIAPQIMTSIDTSGDGALSSAEAAAYARQVLDSLALSVDSRRVPLTLIDVQMPDVRDMALGAGTLRLRAAADLPAGAAGRHQLTLVNSHRQESSVYLANALVPDDRRVEIRAQRRDRDQHGLTIDYDITTGMGWARIGWLLGALATVGALAVVRRTRFRSSLTTPTAVCR
jgi:hypothetical protein